MVLFLILSTCVLLHASEGEKPVSELLVRSTTSWDGEKLPSYGILSAEITILRISVPPHTDLPWHKHPVINAGVLISGELTVINEKQDTLYLRAGDPIVEVVNTWHYGRNEGDEPADIIVFYAGRKNKPVTIYK
ncbi:MAG: cupin domain-containing protein [Candidatus Marinimicrobia bacterium]|nr:cupin domain-containing protein [Candidatus Neomarinimicrobiota bacterium]